MAKKYPKGMAVVQSGETVTAQLYDTAIVQKDGLWLKFNSGGWRTRHTLKCTNLFLKQESIDAKVYQRKGEWYLETRGTTYRYRDGFCINY